MSLNTITHPSSDVTYVYLTDTYVPGVYKLKINIHTDLKSELVHPEPEDLMSMKEVAEYLHQLGGLKSYQFTVIGLETIEHPIKENSVARLSSYYIKLYHEGILFEDEYRTKYCVINQSGGINNEPFSPLDEKYKDKFGFPEGSFIRVAVDVWNGKDYSAKALLKLLDVGGEIVSYNKGELKDRHVTHTIYLRPYGDYPSLEVAKAATKYYP